jgi:predicted DNA-binding transcriptional regulator AlpA
MHPLQTLPADVQAAACDPRHPVDILLTDRESAALLRCGVSDVPRWVAKRIVKPPIKLGGTSRWPRSEILAVIEAAKAERDVR